MDKFYTISKCERCGGSLEGGRTLSIFNSDIICMKCMDEERKRPNHKAALEAAISGIKKGNHNFNFEKMERKEK